jgi:hypothetical protein
VTASAVAGTVEWMRPANLQLVRDLTPDLRGRRLSSPSVTYDGEAIFLAMPPGPPTSRESYGIPEDHPQGPGRGFFPWALYPEQVSNEKFSGDLVVTSPTEWHELPLTDVGLWGPRLQRLSGDEFLAVDVRGWPGKDLNGHVYGPDGRHLRSFQVTGTERLFADESRQIWVTFHDESGGGPDGSALACLDDQGNKRWGFNENRGDAQDVWMFYALNVDREVVWACGYTEFEVVRIKNGLVDHWKQSIGGVEELAVSEPYILMLGAYHKGDPKFWLGRLGEGAIEDVAGVRVTLPDGRALRDLQGPLEKLGIPPAQRPREYGFKIAGRHDALHVFAEDCWFKVTLEDIGG